MSESFDVVIVGGGVTGLTAAHRLLSRRPELRLCLVEASDRLGGCIRTEREAGFVIEAGPDSFLRTKPEAAALCRELGLEGELVSVRAEARSAYLAQNGELERLPAGMVLAAPTRIAPLARTRLLSLPGKLRALADLVMPARTSAEDESIESFLTRRFGSEVASRIGAPLLGGIYAGDIAELSLHATFPQLALLELKFRSVIYGILASALRRGGSGSAARPGPFSVLRSWFQSPDEAAPSPFLSLRSGVGTLVDRLGERVGPGRLRTGEMLQSLEQSGDRYALTTNRAKLSAKHAILTLPAPAAARVVPRGRLSDELAAIRYGSTATVVFAFRKADVERPLDASGFLVPRGEGSILAATWASSNWDGRAPDAAILFRASVGGRHGARELALPDSELVGLALSELERLSGPLGAPLFSRLYRHEGTRPQPNVGHRARLSRLGSELAGLPGLFLAGAGYDGVGIPDCIRQAERAAQAVLGSLAARG